MYLYVTPPFVPIASQSGGRWFSICKNQRTFRKADVNFASLAGTTAGKAGILEGRSAMSSMHERQEARDAVPPRLLVAVPGLEKTGPSRGRVIAAGLLLLGIVLGLSVVVAAFLD